MEQKFDNQLDERSAAAASKTRPEPPAMLRSEDLLQGRSEVWIRHGEDTYRLRLTSAGKLYLTK